MDTSLLYRGNSLKKLQELHGTTLLPYIPSSELIDAVNLAIFLQRPLLIMGEPGSGKTRLAEAVAYEFYGDNFRDFFFRWDIKSTSKARDGIYRYDALRRLRDVQWGIKAKSDNRQTRIPSEENNISSYITKGIMGEAFKSSLPGKPSILLIDEIDKADIDFPNDLLLELDETEFVIEETGERISARCSPIIFITSNNEKDLPSAFLRRCLFHYIEFPRKELLKQIINSHFSTSLEEERENVDLVVSKAVDAFLAIRNTMEAALTPMDKKVSTSELIDWYKAINHYYYNGIKLDGISIEETLEKTICELNEIGRTAIPFHQILLKNWESHLNILAKLDGTDESSFAPS